MSRIGRLPITIPDGVDIDITGTHVVVTGPKGTLQRDVAPELRLVTEDGQLRVERPGSDKRSRELHGLLVIDPVGNGLILPVAGRKRSCDDQLGAAGSAADRELHRLIGCTALGNRGCRNDRRVVDRRGGLTDNPVVGAGDRPGRGRGGRRCRRRRHVAQHVFQAFRPFLALHHGAGSKTGHRIGRTLR